MRKIILFLVTIFLSSTTIYAQDTELSFDNKEQTSTKTSNSGFKGSASKVTFIDEDFEGGSLPTGWTTQDGGSSWVISSDNSSTNWTIPSHTIYASINDVLGFFDDKDNPDTYIATPSIDFTGTTNAKLNFDYFFDDQSGGHWRTKVSIDGGATWTEMEYMEGSFSTWQSKLLDISAFVANEPDVKIAFHFSDTANLNSNSGPVTGFAIDNVQIYETTSHEMGVESIEPNFTIEGNTITPSVTIYNYGTETESTWSLTLSDGSSYTETVTNQASITPETEYVATFPDWSPFAGEYTLEAILTLTDDANSNNDTLRRELNVVLPFAENALVGNGFTEEYFDFNLSNGSTTLIGSITSSPIPTAEEFADNQIFRVDDNGNLYIVDYSDGSAAFITNLSSLSGGIPVGLAYNWDTETMYIASTDGSNITYISTLNLSSFNTTLIGSGSYKMSGMDFDENGNLYATSTADSLVKINTTNGKITNIGYIGHDISYFHDLSFDRESNKMLTIDDTPEGNYYGYYDLETGEFILITELSGTWNNITFTHYYIPYTVTFNVTDGSNPLQNATVNIDGQALTTNSSGETEINLTNDTYDYTVDLAGYDQASSSVTVQGANITENVVLNETTYTATFTVTDGTDPLEGATISITGQSDITTDASGIATIDLPNGSYDYTASLAGYDDFNGTFSISDAAEAVEVVMIETTYTATFTVTDGSTSLEGATISITGQSDITTDASGIATIDLPNGSYDYTASLAGYDDFNGTFSISDAAEAVEVVMIETTYTATFTVTDGANPLEGATVSITGETDLTTNTSGVATIDLTNGTYDYTVTLAGYDDNSGSFTVADGPESIDVSMVETTYTATFTVTDGTDPLEGATISITGETDLTTNTSGQATIELPNGTYDYTVTFAGYDDNTGSFTIADAAETIDISMVETTYTATFTVTDGTAPIVGATVSITGENDITTDASGIASIELVNGEYDYTVSYDGYYDSVGTVTIADSNVDVNIVLHEVGINDLHAIGIKVYPNPTNGILYLNSDKSYTVKVLNTIGNTLFEEQFNGDGTIDLSKQAPGIYFLSVQHNNRIVTKRIILN